MSETKPLVQSVHDDNSIVRASIPLQVLCFIHRPIVFLWFIAEILIFAWKALIPLYNNYWTVFGFEIFALCLTLTLEYIRLELLIYANLTERLFYIILGFFLTLIALVVFLYWILWQWLVLKLEFVLGCTQIALGLFELILAFTTLLSICKKPPKQKTN